jgi:predicted DNA-binding transcriptional regulator AlpA
MPELEDIKKVAARISMSPSWIRKAVASGKFPPGAVRHGKTLWRAEVVTRWIEEQVPLQKDAG